MLNKMVNDYQGYKIYDKLRPGFLASVDSELSKYLKSLDIPSLLKDEVISFEEMKSKTVEFYNKYFDLHDISYISFDCAQSAGEQLRQEKDELEAYSKYFSLLKEVNPFSLTVELSPKYEHPMEGTLMKPIVIIGDYKKISEQDRKVAMSKIIMACNSTILSSATYAHEIAHTQQESHVGYCSNYLNKEVISIFIEKLAALELDPTGSLLKKQERARFIGMYQNLLSIKFNNFKNIMDEKKLLDAHLAVQSGLFAEKLFDNYLSERKQKHKDKYIYDIQDVFDGKITVEELLGKHNITLNNSATPLLIKKHMD